MKQEEIKKLLPDMFMQTATKGNPLTAILDVMEMLHTKTEHTLEHLDAVFDPMRTDEQFVPFLSGWVDMDWLFKSHEINAGYKQTTISTDHLRKLISLAWYLSKWRGSARGLKLFLETATGVEGFSIDEKIKDENNRLIPYHIDVRIPRLAEDKLHLIERIIENEKPAYVTYNTVINDK